MTSRRHAAALGVLVATSLTWPQSIVAQDASAILARAAAYLEDYERTFSIVVSEEHYDQSARRGVGAITSTQKRTLRSDVIVTNAGEDVWVAFRDVFEVDGRPVRDRDARLQRLFVETPSQAMVQGRRIMDESSRYNLGSLRRNVNVPTMALTYLRGSNQPRSNFKAIGRETVNGVRTDVIAFTERASPTVIRSASQDMPATGRFWIDPVQGRIVKSELSVEAKASKTKITVTYAPVPKLTVWAPVSMKEEYSLSTRETINAEAKYSNFRQFNVAVSEDLDATAYLKIAATQAQSKDYKGAETALRRALELDPNLAPAHAALGDLLFTTNRKPEAIDAWKRAVESDGKQFDALFSLTRALAAAGRKDEARTFGERYIATAPGEQYRQNIAVIRKLLDSIKS